MGYVHQITNIDGEDKIFAICNCAVGVCNALRTSQLFNTPNMSRSAYRAHVTKENCVACGRCVEYCPAGAAKLGQKLCTKNGDVSLIRSRNFRMRQSGDRRSGAQITVTRTRSTAMRPVQLRVRLPVRHTFRYRVM